MRKQLAQSITDDELRAAKALLWEWRLNTADQNLNLAFQLSNDWVMAPDTADYIDTLYDLRREDIVDLIERFINRRHHAAVLLTDPQHTLPDFAATLERAW